MSFEIELQNKTEDILPFSFPGFLDEGNCFLRIKVKDGKVIFFCVQLPNYTGTSVTNAIESVFDCAVKEITARKMLHVKENIGFFSSLFTKTKTKELNRQLAIFNYIRENSVLIEHYPPGIGIHDNGSFANVVFGPSGEPAWNYTTKEMLIEFLNDKDVLNLDYKELENWK